MDITMVDLLATLAHFTADTIKDALAWLVQSYQLEEKDIRIYASGGGMHNPLIMKLLQENNEYSFGKIDELGIAGDAKEAVLFALLANETVAGGKSNFGKERGVPSVSMGKISFPN
jgi:anhydro-N-acetylmuramic acid kinase